MDETQVHSLLRGRLLETPGVKLLGWSPPNAKTYGLPNILIPKVIDGRRAGSDRIDACIAYEDVLLLAEIKAASSEMEDDIAKLQRICSCYDTTGLVQIMQRQGVNSDVTPTSVVPTIAFGILDSSLPKDFICWHARPGMYQQFTGSDIYGVVKSTLERLKCAFERKLGNLET